MPSPKRSRSKSAKTNVLDELTSFRRSSSNKDQKSKRIEIAQRSRLPNVFILTKDCLVNININLKSFAKVAGIYYFLTLLLVRGFSTTVNVLQLKNNYLSNKGTSLGSDFSALSSVIGSSFSTTSGASNVYQTALFVVFSLAFIWMLRHVLLNKNLTLRNIFYKSQTPLIPFVIVLIFIILELLPMIIGLFIFSTVFANGIAVHLVEKIIWSILSFSFVATSLYLLVSSIFALYIVTLPDVRPIQALRSSWQLTKKRRTLLLRKVILLPIVLFIILSVVSLIFIAIIPAIADYIYFALSIVAVLLAHSYLYNLYRKMI
jgi:hypothetical protein